MIADTSAWIEYLRATGSRAHRALADSIHQRTLIYLPHVVLQELLQGTRGPHQFRELHDKLDALPPFVADDDRELHALATRCSMRAAAGSGCALRSSIDGLMAACAISGGHPLLAHDRDFTALAQIDDRLRLV